MDLKIIHLGFPLDRALLPSDSSRQVLAIGDFDGTHRGHQDVIRRALRIGREEQLPVAIMSFHPHPREILGLSQYGQYLTPLEEKLRLFEQMGVDTAYVVKFTPEFAKLAPETFISDMLIPMGLHTIVVGFDFNFGYRGAGSVSTLREFCLPDINVDMVPPYMAEGEKVSSTRIRNLLEKGNVSEAAELLGRPYSLYGEVVGGDQRGRTIGFPTANLKLHEPFIVPAKGVYAVRAYIGDKRFGGVMNIGVKPTFTENTVPSLEVHLFDFDRSIYGETVRVDFLSFIRAERKFSSVQELIDQIGKDAQTAKSFYF
ncbi:bifunctional riboflavin kinase/FAD synthetase [Paenibacillus gansuensis]|uniref:Riboflavin biosynthesis protein n=1 Tax=Paenibacillus gansuensis TaxID=306542 RepID=A0ABW5PCI4_9BACL